MHCMHRWVIQGKAIIQHFWWWDVLDDNVAAGN